jgi:Uma2 family endonuclease
MASKTLLTVEEFFERDDLPEDRRYELDEGEIVDLTLPSPNHNRIADQIGDLLKAWTRRSGHGRVYPASTPFALSLDTLRGPDVSFIRKERLESFNEDKPFPGAPDLVVEVVSPSDRRSQLMKKVMQYLSAGAQEVWLVYPKLQTVWAIRERDERTFRSGDTVETPVLPGFAERVEDFFEDRGE